MLPPGNADTFAETLAVVVDALVKRGVDRDDARQVATDALVQMLLYWLASREPWER